jgi:hypothetical protein
MKKILTLILVGLMSTAVFAEAELKEKCIDVKDKDGKVVKDKNGKPKQSCKMIKVHKKLEGTAIPEDKKKK